MQQQTWIITFHNDSLAAAHLHANQLKELLLDAAPPRQIKVAAGPAKSDTQSGAADTIITTLLSSTVLIAAINAIKLWFLRNHRSTSTIELEIKDMKFKATVSEANYKHTLDELLKHAQTQMKSDA
jgi:hypothetical protein